MPFFHIFSFMQVLFFLELKLFSTTFFLWCVILCSWIFLGGGTGGFRERNNYSTCSGFDLRYLIRDD